MSTDHDDPARLKGLARRASLVAAVVVAACAPPSLPLADAGGDASPGPDAGSADLASDAPDLANAAPDLAGDAASGPSGPILYPGDRARSPVTSSVVQALRDIAARSSARDDHVFMKVGASGTVSTSFLYCFADPMEVDLDGRAALEPTLDYFRMGDAAGTTPFDRDTLAAQVGRSAVWAISGNPSPLEQEMAAVNPRFAFVNYGTNDMGLGATYASALFAFHDNLAALLDQLIEAGIAPIVTGLAWRLDSASADLWAPTYNAVIRGLSQARQIPYLDLRVAYAPLPGRGMSADGLHANVYRNPDAQPCDLTAAGLQYGYNTRNLLSLEALHFVKQAVIDGAPPPDTDAPTLGGAGSPADPFRIDALPFSHSADTAASGSRALARYDGCNATQDESGPELVYRLELARRTRVRAVVLDRGSVDVDLHILGGAITEQACLYRNHQLLEVALDAGVYYFVLDSFVSGGVERAGPYLFVVVECEPGDAACG